MILPGLPTSDLLWIMIPAGYHPGKIIDVYSYYTPAEKKYWSNSVSFAKDAVRTRSEWIGEYPYSVVSVVQGPESFGGGMEYPTITVISPTADEKLLDFTIAHEISHNWFYGILASNERKYPWMDEGLNTYYDNRYSQWKHGDKGEIQIGSGSVPIKNLERIGFEAKAAVKKDQPINSSSEEFTPLNYGLIAYYKTGAWLEYAESILGQGNCLTKQCRNTTGNGNSGIRNRKILKKYWKQPVAKTSTHYFHCWIKKEYCPISKEPEQKLFLRLT